MAIRSLLVLLAGLGISGGAVYYAQALMEGERADGATGPAAAPEMSMAQVVVARADIPFGDEISMGVLTTQRWPEEFVPAGMHTALDELVQSDREPRRAIRPISAGEPVLRSKVSDFGATVTVVQSLGPNRRAVAIQVDAVSSVGGFVTPGDRVDVMLTRTREGELESGTILQDLRVIGTDQDTDETRDTARVSRTVTLDVTPEEGQKLALAQRAGSLSLALRALQDAGDAAPKIARLSDLLLVSQPEAGPDDTPTRARPEITIRRGGQASTVTVN